MRKIIIFILMFILAIVTVSAGEIDWITYDDFLDNTINATLWGNSISSCGRYYEQGNQLSMYMKNTQDFSQTSFFTPNYEVNVGGADWLFNDEEYINLSFNVWLAVNDSTPSYGVVTIRLTESPESDAIFYYNASASGELSTTNYDFELYFNLTNDIFYAYQDGVKVIDALDVSGHSHTFLKFIVYGETPDAIGACQADLIGSINITSFKYFENIGPDILNLPNKTLPEDNNPTDNWIDLWNYSSDNEDNQTLLSYSIIKETNSTLIDCSIIGDRFINCSNPLGNESGITYITVKVTDSYGSYMNDTFFVNVTPVNDAPWIMNLTFSPVVVTDNDQTYKAILFDQEGNNIYNWTRWYIDNITNAAWDNDLILDSSNFDKDSEVILEIKTGDDYDNSSWTNFSVPNILFYECNESDEYAIKFTFYDEDTRNNLMNTHLEMEVIYFDETKLFNYDLKNQTNYTFCLNPVDSTLDTNLYLKFYTENYTNRYYGFNNTLTNVSQDILLYTIPDSESKSVLKITVRNKATYQYLPNIVGKLQRKYIGDGEWVTVQHSISDDYGLLLYNINEINTDYKLIFMDKENNIYETTDSMKFLCTDSVCELVYLLDISEAEAALDNLTVWYKYDNNTKNMTTYWNDPTGETTFINTVISKEYAAGSLLICNLSSSSTSGNHTCNLNAYSGTLYFHVYGLINGQKIHELTGFFEVDRSLLGGIIDEKSGALLSFILILSISMIGIISPVGAVIATVLGLITVFYLGLLSALNITFITIVVVLAILVCIKLRD